MTNDTLIPLQVSIRREEELKRKQNQQREMDNRRVAAQTSAFNQSVAATTDKHMRDALSQVRKSDVTLPDTLTRHMGTWVHNQK